MRKFLTASLILHGLIILIIAVGVTNPFKNKLSNQQPMIVDFVDIAEISRAPKLAPKQQAEKKQPEPKPVEKIEPEPMPEQKQENILEEKPLPQPEPEPMPETEPLPEPKPEPDPLPKKEPERIPDIRPKEPKKEEKKPAPQKKKPDPTKDTKKTKDKKKSDKAEVNLDKKKKSNASNKDTKNKRKTNASLDDLLSDVKDVEESTGDDGAPAEALGDTVTASEIDVLRQHIKRCWNVPAGVQGARDLAVTIRMEVAQDGTVTKAEIVDKARMNSNDEPFKAAANSAKRAVLDPQCNPLPLPAHKYDQWKDLEFNFDPKEMY